VIYKDDYGDLCKLDSRGKRYPVDQYGVRYHIGQARPPDVSREEWKRIKKEEHDAAVATLSKRRKTHASLSTGEMNPCSVEHQEKDGRRA
jgi:hypothetical protein